jgi:hypothetical protein
MESSSGQGDQCRAAGKAVAMRGEQGGTGGILAREQVAKAEDEIAGVEMATT